MSPALQQVTARLNKAALDLLAHAQMVESGLGETPLQNHIQTLAQPPMPGMGAEGLSVVLTGLSANAVAKTLSLWLGGDYFSCRALIPSRASCFELSAETGSSWQFTAGSTTSTFESLPALAAAIESHENSTAGPARSPLERCLIRLPGPEGCDGLRVFVPANLEALRSHAALTSWLGDQARLVVLTGHADDNLDSAGVEALQPLVAAVGALRCLVLSGAESRAGLPAWVRMLNASLQLAPQLLQDPTPQALTGGAAETGMLREFARLRQLEGAGLLLQDSLNTDSTSTQNRRRRVDPSRTAISPSTMGENSPRGKLERVLRPFQRDLEELRKNRDEQAARAIGPEGPLYQAVQRIVDGTTFDDMRQEMLNHTIRLTLGAGTLDRVRSMVRQELNQNLREDIQLLSEAVETGVESLREALKDHTGFTHGLRAPAADSERMCDSLGALIQLNIRYKGEIPRATWKTRFQGARNWMMGISMFLMLTTGLGYMTTKEFGQEVRAVLAVCMFFAFLGGLVSAVFGYKKLRAEAIEREMDKLHDAVMQELSRLFQSLMGEKRRIIADHLQGVAREIESEVNQIFQQQNEGNRQELERNRAADAEKGRILDNRLRTLQQSQMACRQVAAELTQAQLLLCQAAAETQRAAPPSAPAAPAMRPPVSPQPRSPATPPDTSSKKPAREPSPLDTFTPPPAVTQTFT